MINKIKHNEMYLNIGEKGHFFLSCDETKEKDYVFGYINTNLILGAANETEYENNNVMPTSDFFRHESTELDGDKIAISYSVNSERVVVKEKLELVEGLNVVRQVTEVENRGDKNVKITKLSSACVTGIGIDGSKYFENDKRFIVNYCYNKWQGEGQWHKSMLKDLGIYPASTHPWEKSTHRFQSIGSYSTRFYYPLIVIEDTEKGESWFFEREGSQNWYMDVTAFEGFNSRFVNVSIGGADESIGWEYDLKPDEKYDTNVCFYGVVKGGIDEVVKTLDAYKRKYEYVHADGKVMFNDFMNCNWAMPSNERLIPLIDAAAEAGCDGFCIDDGWAVTGEWDPIDEKFGSGGFDGIIRYITDKGMRAGVWFEFENATYNVAKELGEDVLMRRNGSIVMPHRPRLDLKNQKARKWLISKIRRVYNAGVRYIKNDQNNDECWGINYNGESPVQGLIDKNKAYYTFIDEVYKEFPDLVIEGCSGGAGRASYDMLKRVSLQSVTDQEDYKLIPSVHTGSLMYYTPEKAGFWAFPYPLLFKNMNTHVIPDDELASFADGRETVFNMVNGMAGSLYLSGKIHLADELNKKLIREGVSVYKTYNKTLPERYPVFPLGLKNLDDKTMNVLGLIDKNGADMLLFVWALENKEFSVDLKKYGFARAEKFYPSADFGEKILFNEGELSVSFKKEYSAMIICLKK